MQSSPTVFFSAELLRPQLPILFLRALPSDPKLPPLCRIQVTDGELRFATMFRRGCAGVRIPVEGNGDIDVAISASRVEAFHHLAGDVALSVDGSAFRYRAGSGATASGQTHPAGLVPEIELPPEIGVESAAVFGAVLDLCVPFGDGSVRRARRDVSAGDSRRSISIETSSGELDWVVARDALPLARAYAQFAKGNLKVLGSSTKMGLATENSWILWPASVAPEVTPLRPAIGGESFELDAESIARAVSFMIGELDDQQWVDLIFGQGEVSLLWRAGGEQVSSEAVTFSGACGAHLRIHAADLRALFPKNARGPLLLLVEPRSNAVILTATQSTQLGGQAATIRRSVAVTAMEDVR